VGMGNEERCKRNASRQPGWPKHRDAALSAHSGGTPGCGTRSILRSPLPLPPDSLRLRPLSLVVLPPQDPPGNEAVHRLAGGEPGFAQPRGALADAAFYRGDRLRTVGALVLEQVAKVLARQQSHPARARVAEHD